MGENEGSDVKAGVERAGDNPAIRYTDRRRLYTIQRVREATLSYLRFLFILVISIPSVALGQNSQAPSSTEARLVSIEAKVDKLQGGGKWNSPTLLLPAIAALAGAAGGWLTGYLTKRLELREGQAAQIANEVVQSLKWFEGGSQIRSIGIAYIETRRSNERYKQFYTVWGSVLANQAIYLLTGSCERNSFHEQDNLERILNLLLQLPLASYNPIRRAYAWKEENPADKGVSLTPRITGLVKQLPKI